MLQDLPLVALMEARAQVWIINAYISNLSMTHVIQALVASVSYQVPSINLDTIEYSQVRLTTRIYHVLAVTHRDQLQSWYHQEEAALLDGQKSMRVSTCTIRDFINTVYWHSENAIKCIGWLTGWLAGWPLVGSWYLFIKGRHYHERMYASAKAYLIIPTNHNFSKNWGMQRGKTEFYKFHGLNLPHFLLFTFKNS